jgi:Fe-S-cluster-containing hydrogenase component 2
MVNTSNDAHKDRRIKKMENKIQLMSDSEKTALVNRCKQKAFERVLQERVEREDGTVKFRNIKIMRGVEVIS